MSIILVLFLNIHRGLKIPFLYFVAFSMRDVYFQLQTCSVEFKGGFPRYFCTKLQRPASLPRLSFANHSLFQLLSPRFLIFLHLPLVLCLPFFSFSPSASVCGPVTLPRCQCRHLEIICFPAHFWARCETGKSCQWNSFIRQFLEPFIITFHINSLLFHTLLYFDKILFERKEKRRFFLEFILKIWLYRKELELTHCGFNLKKKNFFIQFLYRENEVERLHIIVT